MSELGIVVIGRNEGERLKRCLASAQGHAAVVVYVDSGSTDGSIGHAGTVGVEVVELDMSRPFTAARARNRGFERLVALLPGVEFVQFVDGDCEFAPGWLERATKLLADDPRLAMVCGRLRERNRNASVYNRLCDMEWNRPSGVVAYCGGIVMTRRSAFESVGGYDESLIAGEDPELCVRIRAEGHLIRRVSDDMAFHDASMTRFGQWWKRTRRSGWAYAAGAALHGSFFGGHNVRNVLRAVMWGLFLPAILGILIPASFWNGWLSIIPIAILALYAVVILRAFRSRRLLGERQGDAVLFAFFCMLGKPAECLGVAEYWIGRIRRSPARLIEYK